MSEEIFPFPALLADIGGTNARFALLPAAEATPSSVVRLPTAGHSDFAAAARDAIARSGWPRPRSLLVGAAGPVADRSVSLTNARWTIDGPGALNALDLEQGLVLNDFETLAISLPALLPGDLSSIGAMRPGSGNRLVIGPGTGLGVGALVDADGRFLPVPSEGGHTSIAAATPEELEVFRRLGARAGRGRAEALLSGPGLPGIYRAIQQMRRADPTELETAVITERALARTDDVALAAVEMQLDLLARFAGDMALTYMATGGVYLAGGILPRIERLIDPARFRAGFEDNDAHSRLLASLPVQLITAREPALAGLAALARRPETYVLKYAERLWR